MPILIAQQPIIPANVTGLMGFWHSGVQATGAHMLYAAHALDVGMTEDAFVSCARSEVSCLDFIRGETKSVGNSFKNLDLSAESAVEIFRHDILLGHMTLVKSWLDLSSPSKSFIHVPLSPSLWKEKIKALWCPGPGIREFLTGMKELRLFERVTKDVQYLVRCDEAVRFKSEEMIQSAKVIFENLVENGIKYSRGPRGYIQISQKGNRITYEDDGIGMDKDFAKRLGGEDRLREGRAEGVEGSGIGWMSIGRLMRALGWTWEIESEPGEGTKITINLKDGDLVPVEDGEIGPRYCLLPEQLVPAEELIRGAEVFLNAVPFSGHREFDGEQGRLLDVTNSPIWPVIKRGARLMRLLRGEGPEG